MIPNHARKAILALYKFARNADELADDPTGFRLENQSVLVRVREIFSNSGSARPLTPSRRQEGEHGENLPVLAGGDKEWELPEFAREFYELCNKGVFDIRSGIALLDAFIEDCDVFKEYDSWEDTLRYCDRSAATIGKLFLEATKEFDGYIEKADKICVVLQLLNHLQDIKDDYIKLNRVYFDRSFFPDRKKFLQENECEEIKKGKEKVLRKLLGMMAESKDFPEKILSFRVRAELFTIVEICKILIWKLRRKDILKSRVGLNRFEKLFCLIKGLYFAVIKTPPLKVAKALAESAGSSFIRPLKTLRGQRFHDAISFYAFCKRVDDFADKQSSMNPKESLKEFFEQVNSIDSLDYSSYPKHPLIREVNLICKRYGIHKNYLLHVINGQIMDIGGKMFFPDLGLLDKYCFNVAGCVGVASTRIFGYHEENASVIFDFAVKLGKGLQVVNILRDVEEDAEMGRIYVPKELANKYNFPVLKPYELSLDYKSYLPRLKPVFREMAINAEKLIYSALNLLPENEKQNMRPAILMAEVYLKKLQKMKGKDFEFERDDIKLSAYEKFQIFFNN